MAMIVAVVNLKGGTGKTTTAVMLAHAFAGTGGNVVLVDADPQASLLRWSEAAEWEIPAIGLPVKNLHTRLSQLTAVTDIVVIDTPPLDEQSGIVYSALRAADVIVVTMAPTMIEFERLPAVWAAIEDTSLLRAKPAVSAVLLNRTVGRAKSTGVFRGLIHDSGHRVLAAQVPRREAYAQAFGARVSDPGVYTEAATELIELAQEEHNHG